MPGDWLYNLPSNYSEILIVQLSVRNAGQGTGCPAKAGGLECGWGKSSDCRLNVRLDPRVRFVVELGSKICVNFRLPLNSSSSSENGLHHYVTCLTKGVK